MLTRFKANNFVCGRENSRCNLKTRLANYPATPSFLNWCQNLYRRITGHALCWPPPKVTKGVWDDQYVTQDVSKLVGAVHLLQFVSYSCHPVVFAEWSSEDAERFFPCTSLQMSRCPQLLLALLTSRAVSPFIFLFILSFCIPAKAVIFFSLVKVTFGCN